MNGRNPILIWVDEIDNKPELIVSTGTVYGETYYTVQPVNHNWMELESWCLDTFGSCGSRIWGKNPPPSPSERWYMNNSKFWFKYEKDKDWFILKWSS